MKGIIPQTGQRISEGMAGLQGCGENGCTLCWAALTFSFTLFAQAHQVSAFGKKQSKASSLPRK